MALLGCGRPKPADSAGLGGAPAGPSAEGARYLLAAEPAGARSVLEARKETNDGDRVVLAGRIGGSKTPFGKNAIFTVVDASLNPCPDEEGCPTPWDYCCTPDLRQSMATVKFEAQPGKTISQSPQKLLGLGELDLVVVVGAVKRDDGGNLVVLGEGLFVREKHSPKKRRSTKGDLP